MAEPAVPPGERISVFIFWVVFLVLVFFLSDVELCSCCWQPATPEGNSSLRLPTGEPCPCRAELDGDQTVPCGDGMELRLLPAEPYA